MAGVSRISYPPNIRIVRLMCSGRLDPVIVLETLAQGADGVLIMGCHPGDCHYIEGNYQAELKVRMLKKLISHTGLKTERLRLEWVSTSEGTLFAEIVKEFTDQLKNLGPSPLAGEKPDINVMTKILAAKAAAQDFRLRALVGRERGIIEKENAYGEKTSQDDFDRIMDSAIRAEYIRNRIYLLVKNEPLSVKEMAKRLDLDPAEVLRHIVIMRRRGLIILDRVEGTSPLYTALEVK